MAFNSHRIGQEKFETYEDVIEFFKRSEAALAFMAQSLSSEEAADALVDEIFATRANLVQSLNKWRPETLIELSHHLSLWVMHRYPEKDSEPDDEWDRVVLKSYFDLAGLIGMEPVREE